MKKLLTLILMVSFFQCLHAEHIYAMSKSSTTGNPELTNKNYSTTWYAKGIGPVKKVLIGNIYSSSDLPNEEKILVRYYVAK
ncbi:MAG: hypothetical protein IPN89_02340 [Saprospiraceae bacterium]|nr:hypothetical protein [Saprospiraceae bacterium]